MVGNQSYKTLGMVARKLECMLPLGTTRGPLLSQIVKKKTLRKKLKMILATAQISLMSVHFLLEKAAVPADSVSRFIMAATNKEC